MDMEDMDMYIVSSNQNRKVFIKNKRYKIEGVYLLGFLNIAAAIRMHFSQCSTLLVETLLTPLWWSPRGVGPTPS
jgi:hypothetical protein